MAATAAILTHLCLLVAGFSLIHCAAFLPNVPVETPTNEQSGPDFFMATGMGIYNVILEPSSDRSTSIEKLIEFSDITDLSFHFKKKAFVFEAKDKYLYTSYFNVTTGNYSEPTILVEDPHELKGHSLDSLHDWVYYVTGSRGVGYLMGRTSLDGKEQTNLTMTSTYTSINYRTSVDPSKGWLVYQMNNMAYGYDLVTGKEPRYDTEQSKVEFLVADAAEGRLFILTSDKVDGGSLTYILTSVEYDGSGKTEIYRGAELTNANAMDVFKNQVVWTTSNDQTSFYYCKLSPTCRKEDLIQYKKGLAEKTVAIKLYHPGVQPQSQRCADLGCSHFCRDDRCVCLFGMELQKDLRSCTTTTPKIIPKCTTHDDCPPDRACVASKCVDPCKGRCGNNAKCVVRQHIPNCTCKPGFDGNALVDCALLECGINKPCPLDRACVASKCVDPCKGRCGNNTQCVVHQHIPNCACKPGFTGNALIGCVRRECDKNEHCASDKACDASKCVDPCKGHCGNNADCLVDKHVPNCACKPGLTGNPLIECNASRNKSYSICDWQMNFYEALEFCKQAGKKLATVEIANHNQLVNVIRSKKYDIHSGFWLAVSDSDQQGIRMTSKSSEMTFLPRDTDQEMPSNRILADYDSDTDMSIEQNYEDDEELSLLARISDNGKLKIVVSVCSAHYYAVCED